MAAELVNFSLKTLEPAKVIGRELRVLLNQSEGSPVPAFWDRCFTDGTVAALESHPDRLHPNR